MTCYIFINTRQSIETRHPIDLRDDLSARRHASITPNCIRVETESARVVWRKPMDEQEFEAVMRGRNGRS